MSKEEKITKNKLGLQKLAARGKLPVANCKKILRSLLTFTIGVN